ncbi:similar to Saccharomyces cerevisiae YBR244W GPX2 Phospholipid hydroperoxide glutathione peroxidase induced by glucose starvation [Maudiozyma saulgeensis]|uniref:Glutathione peroxidase n=1 Tax=Maudiozyma saulgeensis TaxID=1789683 RepID=A0A1X7RAW3_9SACH|nr:similar to Saccharomyces cerevisiae YBR244W GPX2 Phospholipid hydroperoxide glutathione peroxidase induced by glucose starvation [Kazachstania saulgeensis]
MSTNFYQLEVQKSDQTVFSFEQLKGKVVLIVNVASNCGYTPQYKELEFMYQKCKDQGFQVLGFPCNQFGHQEPGTNEEIRIFCKRNYGVSFPVFPKVYVNGPKQHPVYAYLQSHLSGDLGVKGVRWNFEKFLVDGNGNVVKRYNALTRPIDIQSDIIELLQKL